MPISYRVLMHAQCTSSKIARSQNSYSISIIDYYSSNSNSYDGYNNMYNYTNPYQDPQVSQQPPSDEDTVPYKKFEDAISTYLEDQRRDSNSLIRFPNFHQLKKQMLRVYTRRSVLFCIDIEAWEQDHSKVTEIGIAIYDPSLQELASVPNIINLHLKISENLHLRNGKYVPDHKDNFMGKYSWDSDLKNSIYITQGLINRYLGPQKELDCVLVGHGLQNDIRWLRQLKIIIPSKTRQLDTQTVYSYTHGRDRASLKNCLMAVDQPAGLLHNAGNDAYYTILLALKLCDPQVRTHTGLDYDIDSCEREMVSNCDKIIKMFS